MRRISKTVTKPYRWIARRIHRARYDQAIATFEQDRSFAQLGLSRQEGVDVIDTALSAHPELAGSKQSEHFTLFGTISQRLDAKSILEIGTYDGRFAVLLANIFPSALIDTIDLCDSDPAFINTYKRRENSVRAAFVREQDDCIRSSSRIRFKEL